MTDRKEIESLIDKAVRRGAVVHSTIDKDGWYVSLRVSKLHGVGPHPMSPLAFAERMRTIPAWWQV